MKQCFAHRHSFVVLMVPGGGGTADRLLNVVLDVAWKMARAHHHVTLVQVHVVGVQRKDHQQLVAGGGDLCGDGTGRGARGTRETRDTRHTRDTRRESSGCFNIGHHRQRGRPTAFDVVQPPQGWNHGRLSAAWFGGTVVLNFHRMQHIGRLQVQHVVVHGSIRGFRFGA